MSLMVATNVGHINKPFTDVEIKKVISALLPNFGKQPSQSTPKPAEVVNAIPENPRVFGQSG